MTKHTLPEENDPLEFHSPRTAEAPGPTEDDDACCSAHAHVPPTGSSQNKEAQRPLWYGYIPAALSLVLLLTGILLDSLEVNAFQSFLRIGLYGLAYLLVGLPVLKQAFRNIRKGDVFNEFFLMSLATLGAFYLGEYAEGVAVLLFYVIGEHIQELAVARSRSSIRNLVDSRPAVVETLINGQWEKQEASKVKAGDILRIKAGERVAVDGILNGPPAAFNTSALTGESIPQLKHSGDQILAGMLNLENATEMKVEKAYNDSTLSKMMYLIEDAAKRKASTQRFITRFAKVYTPVVVFLALGILLLPALWETPYEFNTWLYRALVFLVISCPCALVVSIPLGFFGGIGAASRHGILFKGANYLERITEATIVALDKTGTLTHGNFEVQHVGVEPQAPEDFMFLVAALESHSTHPIARAILKHSGAVADFQAEKVEEKAGLGIRGKINGSEIIAGSTHYLQLYGISYDLSLDSNPQTIVAVAIDGEYAGYISIADEIKQDAALMVKKLKALGVQRLAVLSGDKPEVVKSVARKLGIDEYAGGLLPEDKLRKVEHWIQDGQTVAFAGDGLNDAPVITRADIGIAMGGLGSDASIETADVVIQTDQPSKIATAIQLGKKTKQIVWQNIGLAFGVKLLVLLMGASGIATLWEAVFADVGVALLAILNAVRLQYTSLK